MTTRRRFLVMAGGAAGLAVAGAGASAAVLGRRGGAESTAPAAPDVVLADIDGGLGTVRDGGLRAAYAPAVATRDARTVIAATHSGDATRLSAIDAGAGTETGSAELAGRWTPLVVAPDAQRVALTDGPATVRPAGRRATTVLVTDRLRERYRITLDGNYVPEAFAVDGRRLFVLQWLPPLAPDRYRVRILDLASGAVGPLSTRAKVAVPAGAEEEMRGDSRQAVYAPDAKTLYTLYTHQPDHRHTRDLLAGGRPGGVHAFVHTLNLQDGWAYCLDLPEPFGHGPATGHALAVTADRLYVADATSGRLAVADTASLRVTDIAGLPAGAGTMYAAAGRWLYLGCERVIRRIDPGTWRVEATWDTPAPVRGLAVSPDGARLYAGYPGGVIWRDAASGAVLGRQPVTGLRELRGVLARAV